jgi:hypothetical protein
VVLFDSKFALLNKKFDAFSAESINFSRIFSALSVERFYPNFTIFFKIFFTSSENAINSKFRQETLNILSALKYTGLNRFHLESYFSIIGISPPLKRRNSLLLQ